MSGSRGGDPDNYKGNVSLFALQDFHRIAPRRLHRLRPDQNECDQQYRQQAYEQLGDLHRSMIREIRQDNFFKEKVS